MFSHSLGSLRMPRKVSTMDQDGRVQHQNVEQKVRPEAFAHLDCSDLLAHSLALSLSIRATSRDSCLS